MDHIFTIWLTDKDWAAMPFLDEICIASAQVVNKKPITIYTNHKLHLSFLDRTITKVEMIDEDLLKHVETITDNKAHQSDYIRLYLLAQKGGIYFDTDILFWDSFQNMWDKMEKLGYGVLYPREDQNMICNCMIMCTDPIKASPFFTDMLNTYDTRFIKHSYLFNSQKYINLMSRKYPDIITVWKEPSLFETAWNGNIDKFLSKNKQDGIGQHLYSSIENWNNCRFLLDQHCYSDRTDCFPINVTRDTINKYIDLMKEEDTNVKE